MNENNHIRALNEIVRGNWSNSSILVHNRIADVRILLDYLGPEFKPMQVHLTEIETLSGTALGIGDDYLNPKEVKLLDHHIECMKEILNSSI